MGSGEAADGMSPIFPGEDSPSVVTLNPWGQRLRKAPWAESDLPLNREPRTRGRAPKTAKLQRQTARPLASFAPLREWDVPLPALTAPRLQRSSAECCFNQCSAVSKSGQTRATSRQYRSEWFISRR
jgi:hypothetical protein